LKILTILGARPQFIKAGAVSREIKRQKEEGKRLEEVIVHTGQHYDKNMSDVFFEELQIPKPDYFLGVGGKSHGAMTGEMIIKLEEVMLKEKPDVVLVYGDTNSTLAGAVTASKLHIPIAHIEAGLRSFNMKMPEEINRILTDRVSKWLFCPTDTAVKNLKKEGFPFPTYQSTNTPITNNQSTNQQILNVGDVMLDAAMFYKQFAKKPQILTDRYTNTPITNNYILCTIHRAENTDDPERLKSIFEALEEIAKEIQIILPLHPRTRQKLTNIQITNNQLTIIDPVGYLEMTWLLDNCSLVMTDSGGLQKEAYFFKKPCITLRDETEWVELVEVGANVLVGADKEKIIESYLYISNMLLGKEKTNTQITNNKYTNTQTYQSTNLYGDGKASEKIVREL
jgi:UDP-GlcNAc3NAcA epimerase